MTAVSLGPAVGKAHVKGQGMATVFDSDRPNYFTVQIDRTGNRTFKHRDSIEWRTTTKKKETV